MATTHHFFLNQ